MVISTATFNPSIDYSDGTFNFATNKMYLVSAPQEDFGLRWDQATVPQQDGGDALGGERDPLDINFTFILQSTNPATIQTTLEALKTAFDGKATATSSWSKGHFRFYLHNSGGNTLYLNECILNSRLRIGRASDFYLKGGPVYTPIGFGIRAMTPGWQTGGAAAAGDTISAPVIIEGPTGTDFIICYNTTTTSNVFKVDSSGNIQTTDELESQQATIT